MCTFLEGQIIPAYFHVRIHGWPFIAPLKALDHQDIVYKSCNLEGGLYLKIKQINLKLTEFKMD